MSTPVGHSRLQPLHDTQSSNVSNMACEVNASCGASISVLFGKDFVLGPVEGRLDLRSRIAWLKTEQRAIVHLRRPHNFAGIHETVRIEEILDLLERVRDARSEH